MPAPSHAGSRVGHVQRSKVRAHEILGQLEDVRRTLHGGVGRCPTRATYAQVRVTAIRGVLRVACGTGCTPECVMLHVGLGLQDLAVI
jgi:hypothetical protein